MQKTIRGTREAGVDYSKALSTTVMVKFNHVVID